jgi:hypothetical protein
LFFGGSLEEHMAKKFFLFEIEGDEDFLRGTLGGYFSAMNEPMEGVFFGSEHGLEDEGFLEKLVEFLGIKRENNLLIVAEEKSQLVKDALSQVSELNIRGIHPLKSISYPFEVLCYNEVVGLKVRETLENLPEGAKATGLASEEKKRPEHFEISVYTPEHPYRFHAKGEIVGEVEAVLRSYRVLSEFDVMRFGEANIELEQGE